MLGRDHALSGALAFAGVAPMLHVTGTQLAAGIARPRLRPAPSGGSAAAPRWVSDR